MKKLFITIAFLFILAGIQAQGFFRPVPKDLFKDLTADRTVRAGTAVWLMRPAIQVSAMQFLLTNPVQVAAFNSLGTGLSYVHFIEQNGEPYANFGINALVLFDTNPGGVEPAKISIAASVSALQFINVGVGYGFGNKKIFILSGITFNFN